MNRFVLATVTALLLGSGYALAQDDTATYVAGCDGVAVAADCSSSSSCSGTVEVLEVASCSGVATTRVAARQPVRRVVRAVVAAPVRLVGRVTDGIRQRHQARVERRQSRRAARRGCGG